MVIRSIKLKVFLSVGIPLFFLLALNSYWALHRENSQMLKQHLLLVEDLLETGKRSAIRSVRKGNMVDLQKILEEIGHVEGLNEFLLANKEGEVRYSSSRERVGERITDPEFLRAVDRKERLSFTRRGDIYIYDPFITEKECVRCHLNWEERSIETVFGIKYSLASFMRYRAANFRDYAVALTAITTVVGLMIWMVMGWITRPIRGMVSLTGEIVDGDLTRRIDIRSGDEIGILARAFNDMAENLQEIIKRVRDMTGRVSSASQELASAVTESTNSIVTVSSNIHEVSQWARDNANNLENVSRIVEELVTSSVEQMKSCSKEASARSDEADRSASEGETAVRDTVNAMGEIKSVVVSLADEVNELGEASKAIGDIIDTMRGIADQTNLLALNAAIEAARAGEQGRGFAVVAEEVRKLAEDSAQSAEEIDRLIRDILAKLGNAIEVMGAGRERVDRGTEVAATMGKKLEVIVGAIREIRKVIDTVITISTRQMQERERIYSIMNEVLNTTRKTASGAEEVSSAVEQQAATVQEISSFTEELRNMAEELYREVSRFRVGEEGKGLSLVEKGSKPLKSGGNAR
ncbi:MAG: methyl-accepting chemotaxis protein [bacterium]